MKYSTPIITIISNIRGESSLKVRLNLILTSVKIYNSTIHMYFTYSKEKKAFPGTVFCLFKNLSHAFFFFVSLFLIMFYVVRRLKENNLM